MLTPMPLLSTPGAGKLVLAAAYLLSIDITTLDTNYIYLRDTQKLADADSLLMPFATCTAVSEP